MLYIVGIGPGKPEYMTLEAEKILTLSDLIVGYSVYIDCIRERFPEKEFYTTPMTKETERCRYSLKEGAHRRVALVCSGDAGVYGMAGLVYELSGEYPDTEIRVAAGVTAACSGGAVLGAPLTHDFAVISLSDLMTPLEEIRQKIRAAAMCGFVIVLYNPASRRRKDYLKMACDIILEYREEQTVCGYVKNIGRENTEKGVLTLKELREFPADMFTTVYIGNRATENIGGYMVTPRGYDIKS